MKAIAVIFLSLLTAAIIIAFSGSPSASSSALTSSGKQIIDRRITMTIPFPCGKTDEDANRAVYAIRNKDFAALAGLADRGTFFTVDKGEVVKPIFSGSHGYSEVEVLSGYHMGESCWMATAILQDQ